MLVRPSEKLSGNFVDEATCRKLLEEPLDHDLLDLLRRDVVEGAQRLLGSHLVLGALRAAIVETEAYRASDDPASHAYRGMTRRNQVMFEEPGHAYVYFNYGCHWMLNITAHDHGDAAGVLIRAAQPLEGLEEMVKLRGTRLRRVTDRGLLSGPGKLTQAFGISGSVNGLFLFDRQAPLHIEAQQDPRPFVARPRVGIAKGKGDEIEWRFVDSTKLEWASSPKPKISL